MNKHTFELTWDQIDAIVISELTDLLNSNLRLDYDEGGLYIEPNWKIIDAAIELMIYYLPTSAISEFIDKVEADKQRLRDEIRNLDAGLVTKGYKTTVVPR